MLQIQTFKSLSAAPFLAQLALHQGFKSFSSRSHSFHTTFDDTDLDAARIWYRGFDQSTIPRNIAKTTFVRSSGAGGQKTNKTSNKANTVWPMEKLRQYVPKVIQSGLRNSRYYVLSSDSITINSEISRKQSENTNTTHEKLFDEITQIYKHSIPGITSPEQKKKIEALLTAVRLFKPIREREIISKEQARLQVYKEVLASTLAQPPEEKDAQGDCKMRSSSRIQKGEGSKQKSDNAARLRMKKKQSDKKKSRSGDGRGDF